MDLIYLGLVSPASILLVCDSCMLWTSCSLRTDGCGECVLGTMDFDELFVSTMCSGSGGAELAVQAFSEGFEDVTGRPLLTATPFACENAAFKQGHLKRLLTHLHPAGNWCIFDDITTMTGKDRRCGWNKGSDGAPSPISCLLT
jgi:hypothetical protein